MANYNRYRAMSGPVPGYGSLQAIEALQQYSQSEGLGVLDPKAPERATAPADKGQLTSQLNDMMAAFDSQEMWHTNTLGVATAAEAWGIKLQKLSLIDKGAALKLAKEMEAQLASQDSDHSGIHAKLLQINGDLLKDMGDIAVSRGLRKLKATAKAAFAF